jgi:hypothetical protein
LETVEPLKFWWRYLFYYLSGRFSSHVLID